MFWEKIEKFFVKYILRGGLPSLYFLIFIELGSNTSHRFSEYYQGFLFSFLFFSIVFFIIESFIVKAFEDIDFKTKSGIFIAFTVIILSVSLFYLKKDLMTKYPYFPFLFIKACVYGVFVTLIERNYFKRRKNLVK